MSRLARQVKGATDAWRRVDNEMKSGELTDSCPEIVAFSAPYSAVLSDVQDSHNTTINAVSTMQQATALPANLSPMREGIECTFSMPSGLQMPASAQHSPAVITR